MNSLPIASADQSLPYSLYRFGNYVGNAVKVIILICGDDDGTMPALADRFTVNGTADLASMFNHPYADTTAWDFGCEGRDWSSSVAAVGFLNEWDRKHMDLFSKENPALRLIVSWGSADVNGSGTWHRGKCPGYRNTNNVWRASEAGMKQLPYAEFQKLAGDLDW